MRRWWTGATDSELEGDWRWTNSGQPVGDFVWMRNTVQISGDQRSLEITEITKIKDSRMKSYFYIMVIGQAGHIKAHSAHTLSLIGK